MGFDPAQPTQNALAGARVTCMHWSPERGDWIVWPAEMYENQINPQVTGTDGYFAFFTPPGLYYLQVGDKPGFQPWRSPTIEVIAEIVHVNVPLTPVPGQEGLIIDMSPGSADPLQEVTIPVGSSVEWLASGSGLGALSLLGYGANPVIRILSEDPPIVRWASIAACWAPATFTNAPSMPMELSIIPMAWGVPAGSTCNPAI